MFKFCKFGIVNVGICYFVVLKGLVVKIIVFIYWFLSILYMERRLWGRLCLDLSFIGVER